MPIVRKVVKNLKASPGIQPDHILIVINEPEMVNWGIRSKCADEIDIGFNVNV